MNYMNGFTNLQRLLMEREVPLSEIRDRLNVDRTTPGKWARGVLFPNRIASQKLIALFAEHGISLDYNDIYKIHGMDEAI